MRVGLFGHDQLHDEVVGDAEAGGGLDVADGMGALFDRGRELHLDQATLGVEVGFPPLFDLFAADDAGVLTQNAFALRTDLLDVFGARSGDHLGVLLDAPVHLPDPPAAKMRLIRLHHSGDPHLHVELANRMNHRRGDDGGRQVGGWEDAERGSVCAGEQRPQHFDRGFQHQIISEWRGGLGREHVVHGADHALGRCREAAGQQEGKGEGVAALVVPLRFGQKVPLVQLGGLGFAVGAVPGDWSLARGLGQQSHLELLELHLFVVHGEGDHAGQERAAGVAHGPVHDQRGRFDGDVELGGFVRRELGAAADATALVLAVLEVEEVHGVAAGGCLDFGRETVVEGQWRLRVGCAGEESRSGGAKGLVVVGHRTTGYG